MSFAGMDIEATRSLGSTFAKAADALAAAETQLSGELARSPWQGPDASSFRSDWNGPHRAALRRTADSLRSIGSLLLRQAEQQQNASERDGGGLPAGFAAGQVGASRGYGGTSSHATGGGDIFSQLAPLPRTLTGLVPGLQNAVGNLADLAMRVPLVEAAISAGFGFEYVKGQDFYTTNQTSIQSHLGFMDAFDKLGFAGGMDLDDSVTQFEYGGQEYRLELWKGNYGAGAAFGGEIGLYVRDPDKDVWESPGQAIPGFYPAADQDERIHMVQQIYDVNTGETYFTSDGHDTIGGDQYWNAAIRTTPGIDKDDLGQRGTLYVDDPGLRDAMVSEMRREGLDVRVDVRTGAIDYDWR
ncbi:DUF4474 domain-containing protein [Microbacterium rhizomatis]|uniref:DUF4474 domain-containing protein n=1 Tax=Microbacterium rhizomatis TaxID=1631477 RepID=A0A5J5J659_9MICO|nr:DUF4474 domain-containing protein [Microbacterium rhizomatis]KAA9111511.1 DUF4474 domain-containing protein [Microbacterium rhizomatis]